MTVLIYFYDISFAKDKSYKMNSHHLSNVKRSRANLNAWRAKSIFAKQILRKVSPLGTRRWFPWLYVVGILDAYNSPKVRTEIRIPKDMGIVWETYHKGVPLWGAPGNTIEKILSIVFQPTFFIFPKVFVVQNRRLHFIMGKWRVAPPNATDPQEIGP